MNATPSATAQQSPWQDVRPSWWKIVRWLLLHSVVIGTFIAAPTFTPTSLAWLSLSIFVVSCLGVSVGMHRGIIHGAFKMQPWFRAGVVYICCLSGMGGPSSFIRMHRERDYHQDQPTCPSLFGYRLDPFRSYIQMVFCEYTGAPVPAHHPHPPSDAWMRFLDRVYLLAPIPGWAFLWLVGRWDAVWWGGLLPWALIQNLFWASNYLVHTRGYVTFPRPGHAEQGFNQRLLGAMSFGEGFHNNHHQFPGSARMGLGKLEIDLGYQVIRMLKALGIVWDVKLPASAELQPPPSDSARSAASS